jgi:hypothetical protein
VTPPFLSANHKSYNAARAAYGISMKAAAMADVTLRNLGGNVVVFLFPKGVKINM